MAKKKKVAAQPETPKGPELVIFSDLHYREESADTCLQVLDGVFQEAMKRDRKVACLGDFWHNRYQLPVELLNRLTDEFYKWAAHDVELIFNIGNHDQCDVNGRHALEVFMGWPNIRVYTEPMMDEWGLWIPYRKNPLEVVKVLDEHQSAGITVFAHCGIRGAQMNINVEDTDGIPADQFGGYKNVLLGHYHKRQTLVGANTGVKVQYIGSPWETRADEGGDPKGFAIWDGTNLHYQDRCWGPKHHKFEVASPEELKAKMAALGPGGAGDRIRIQVSPGASLEAISAASQQLGVKGVTVEPLMVDTKEVRLGLGAGAGWREYAEKYIAYESASITASNLDLNHLMGIFDHVTGMSPMPKEGAAVAQTKSTVPGS